MPPYPWIHWTTDPEYIDLLNYTIQRTENVKSPINIQQLARDFKEKSGTALRESCIKSRIERMRKVIHRFEHIETDTRVRMLFAFSAPVNRYYLQKISNDAHVEVDENDRITHYKSEQLELKGYHRLLTTRDTKVYWTTDIESINLLNYLIEETEYVKSPMNLVQLARDFKRKSGTLQTAESLEYRIIRVRFMTHNFDHIDTNTKVKLLFALSAPVNANFLEELKENAAVQVDEQNRITYYKSIKGGLELSGDHSLTAKLLKAHLDNKHDVVPKTGDEEELGSIDFITRSPSTFETPKSSKRKADTWVSSSSKRTLSSPNCSSLELLADYVTDYSIDDQVKFESFRGEIQEDLSEIVEEKDIRQILEPMENPIKIEVEEPVEVKPETSHNPRIKFFEAMQSMILFLDTHSLSWIQSKINQKIQKIKGLDEVILNNEIVKIVDSLIFQISNHSVVNLSENAETVNLSNCLCYLKASILNSKMSGMEGLVQNISKLIEEPQNKRVPMEKVTNALRTTLDIDNF